MALIVCHGPKGGVGTTFISAHLAMAFAATGATVTVLSVAARDTLPLHFGLPLAGSLPHLGAPADSAVVAAGIDLRNAAMAPRDPDFVPMLRDLGFLMPGPDRVLVLDVPAGEPLFAQRMIAHASAHLCPLDPHPDTLALLPQVFEEAGSEGLQRTAFVINRLDDTRRLSRHNAAFIRELAGSRLIGRIRLDESVREAIAMLQPLAKYSPASAALGDVQRIGSIMAPALENTAPVWVAPEAESRAA